MIYAFCKSPRTSLQLCWIKVFLGLFFFLSGMAVKAVPLGELINSRNRLFSILRCVPSSVLSAVLGLPGIHCYSSPHLAVHVRERKLKRAEEKRERTRESRRRGPTTRRMNHQNLTNIWSIWYHDQTIHMELKSHFSGYLHQQWFTLLREILAN